MTTPLFGPFNHLENIIFPAHEDILVIEAAVQSVNSNSINAEQVGPTTFTTNITGDSGTHNITTHTVINTTGPNSIISDGQVAAFGANPQTPGVGSTTLTGRQVSGNTGWTNQNNVYVQDSGNGLFQVKGYYFLNISYIRNVLKMSSFTVTVTATAFSAFPWAFYAMSFKKAKTFAAPAVSSMTVQGAAAAGLPTGIEAGWAHINDTETSPTLHSVSVTFSIDTTTLLPTVPSPGTHTYTHGSGSD